MSSKEIEKEKNLGSETPTPVLPVTPQGQAKLSPTQTNLLIWLSKDQCARQVAGHSSAPWLSAGHALVRKGLAYTRRTGHFGLEEAGRKLAKKLSKGAEHKP